MPTLSFVVPCFNEEDVLPQTIHRVLEAGGALGASFEAILVDDGSTDRTWDLITAAARQHPSILGVRLSRNFGQQPALIAGLSRSTGEHVLLLDADLQDPPDLAPALLARAREGYDVVVGVRRSRAGETWTKRATAWMFHRILNVVAEKPIPVDSGIFALLSRRAVDSLLARTDLDRYLRALLSLLPFPHATLAYDRPARAAGATHYSFRGLVRVAWHGIRTTARRASPTPCPASAVVEIGEVTAR